jgi:hypothetical protein
MRRFTALLMSALVLGATVTEAAAQSRTVDPTQAYPGEGYVQYRGYDRYDRYDRWERRRFERERFEREQARRYYRAERRRDRNDAAAVAVGAGILGALALGAAASAAQAQPALPRPPATVDPQLAAWCAKRYRSFDSVTGTFLASNGQRLVCTYN